MQDGEGVRHAYKTSRWHKGVTKALKAMTKRSTNAREFWVVSGEYTLLECGFAGCLDEARHFMHVYVSFWFTSMMYVLLIVGLLSVVAGPYCLCTCALFTLLMFRAVNSCVRLFVLLVGLLRSLLCSFDFMFCCALFHVAGASWLVTSEIGWVSLVLSDSFC